MLTFSPYSMVARTRSEGEGLIEAASCGGEVQEVVGKCKSRSRRSVVREYAVGRGWRQNQL